MPIDSVYRHYEDDGRLSMFTSGGEILITCSEGHLRRLRADETGWVRPPRGRSVAKSAAVKDIGERFGSDALRALGF